VHDLDGAEEVKLLGVYSCEDRARSGLERARTLPGFRDIPEGLLIDKYELDRDKWTEGFVTIR